MRGDARSRTATLVFFAFTAPLGIVAHLVSEFAGLGWHDDGDVLFSARHAYLAVVAVVSILALWLASRGIPRRERRARVAALVESLPFRGRGVAFVALSFVVQFAFFALTQVGEGCPLCSGDVVVGVFAAAFAALVGAIAVALGQRRVLLFVLALAGVFVARTPRDVFANGEIVRRSVLAPSVRRTPFAFRYRPPPAVQFA